MPCLHIRLVELCTRTRSNVNAKIRVYIGARVPFDVTRERKIVKWRLNEFEWSFTDNTEQRVLSRSLSDGLLEIGNDLRAR